MQTCTVALCRNTKFRCWRVTSAATDPKTRRDFRVAYGNKAKERADAYAQQVNEAIAQRTDRMGERGGPTSRRTEKKAKPLKTGTSVIQFIVQSRSNAYGVVVHAPAIRFDQSQDGEVTTMSRSIRLYGLARAWELIHEKYMSHNNFETDPLDLVCPTMDTVMAYYRPYGISELPA